MKRIELVLMLLLVLFPLSGKSYYVENADTYIKVNMDGTLDVEESYTYKFEGGPFSFISREVHEPVDGFIEFKSAYLNGKKMSEGVNAGELCLCNNDILKTRVNLGEVSNTSVVYKLVYQVKNAVSPNKMSGVLEWEPLPHNYKFKILKGKVTLEYPQTIPMFEITTLYDIPKKKCKVKEEGQTVVFNYKNFKKDNIYIETIFPFNKMSLKHYRDPSLYTKKILTPQERAKVRALTSIYKKISLFLLIYLIIVLIIISYRAIKRKSTIEIKKGLPLLIHPAIVGRLIDNQKKNISLVSVLISMANKKMIHISQRVTSGGKKVDDFWCDINKEVATSSNLEQSYLELLKNEEVRTKKRVELKKLLENVDKVDSEVVTTLDNECIASGYFSEEGQKKYSQRLYFSFVISFLAIGSIAVSLILFNRGYFYFPIVTLVLFLLMITSYIFCNNDQQYTALGLEAKQSWLGFRKYILSETKRDKRNLKSSDAELWFPYLLVLGVGGKYIEYFKRNKMDIKLSNLGEIAENMQVLNTFISTVVVSSVVSTSGGSVGGGGSASAG